MATRLILQLPAGIDAIYRNSPVRPTLLDIGAAGTPPGIWRALAPYATYVGVGPGAQPLTPDWDGTFAEAHFSDRIVTVGDVPSTPFYSRSNPVYSSVLEPHPAAISQYLQPRLEVGAVTSLPAITMDRLVRDLSLPSVNWIHMNVGGIDVPLIQSLSADTRRRVLAIDTCLYLVDMYVGHGSGIARCSEFLDEGFWLSRLHCYGPLRMRPESLAKLTTLEASIDESLLRSHDRAPGWVFVRFFRTAESMAAGKFSWREYLLLWTFVLLDDQLGFAADLLCEYESRFGVDSVLERMRQETLARLRMLDRA